MWCIVGDKHRHVYWVAVCRRLSGSKWRHGHRLALSWLDFWIVLFKSSAILYYICITVLPELPRSSSGIPNIPEDSVTTNIRLQTWKGSDPQMIVQRIQWLVEATTHSCLTLCKLFKVKQIFTSSFHPQTNSRDENRNSVILISLQSYHKFQNDWSNLLPAILWSYCASTTTLHAPSKWYKATQVCL